MVVLSVMVTTGRSPQRTSPAIRLASEAICDVFERARCLRPCDDDHVRRRVAHEALAHRRTRGLDDLDPRHGLRRVAVRDPDELWHRVAEHPGRRKSQPLPGEPRRVDLHLGVRGVSVLLRVVAGSVRYTTVDGDRGRVGLSRRILVCRYHELRNACARSDGARVRIVLRLCRCRLYRREMVRRSKVRADVRHGADVRVTRVGGRPACDLAHARRYDLAATARRIRHLRRAAHLGVRVRRAQPDTDTGRERSRGDCATRVADR